MQNPLTIIGVVFVLLAGIIIRMQLGAKHCSRHTRTAGVFAWIISIICLLVGMFFIVTGRWG